MKQTLILFLFFPLLIQAQKKPLDHSVFDGWQSIGERMISDDGNWVAFTVTPQEGDADLIIKSTNSGYEKRIPRGYNVLITPDSRFLVFRIRPLFRETREARIRKKRPDDFPKDSIGIIELGKDLIVKLPRVRSYKAPEKAGGWLAYHKEKDPVTTRSAAPTQKTVDSLKKTIDSLTLLLTQVKNMQSGNRDEMDADDDPAGTASAMEGSDLVLRHLSDGKERLFPNVADYFFSEEGHKLLLRITRSAKDRNSAPAILLVDLEKNSIDTIMKGGNDFRNFALSKDGNKIAFVAERDTNTKALQKFYGLYLYRSGDDSAYLLADKNSEGMKLGMTISENGQVSFSKSGNRLFFGTAPIAPPRDTSLVEIDLVKLDVWHYKDDYLQTQQLFQLNNELRRSYLAMYDFPDGRLLQLGDPGLPTVVQTNEGDGAVFFAVTDTGRRVESQWSGATKKDLYELNLATGEKKLIRKNHEGAFIPSPAGKYALLYNNKSRHFETWDGKTLKNITAKIRQPLYNEENDTPSDPGPYGVMGWHEGDSAVYIYDRYDIWKVEPKGQPSPELYEPNQQYRKKKTRIRYVSTDPEQRFITAKNKLVFRLFNEENKKAAFVTRDGIYHHPVNQQSATDPYGYATILKAKNANTFLFSRESFTESPDLYIWKEEAGPKGYKKISTLNPQQAQFNWVKAELYRWKTFDGKLATGILYKPEDFDSTRKYPMLIYFYERVSDGLYGYIAPSPTPSRLNIPFFVSRGYLVFTPDIHYTRGQPGPDAYNFIVSGAQALAKKKWVDGKNIGIQGQSWGGYQVAHLITATNMFKAAWAGAPVVNMFSAYGGIRWESGNNRQFQYEKGQSRIGATPWERPDLYIKNSPFFHLKKATTPLVIMSNDADGAVPWYQGIEFFTAMRRLGKKVWLLNYNGEAHNLVERKNRKDIQIRQQEYFDWLLKGEKPARWITDGIPAVKKGKDWGLELVDEKKAAAF